MKRHIKYLAFIIAALKLSFLSTDICSGQTQNETAYYNNPDIISNRLQKELAAEQESLYKNTKLAFATIEEARTILTTKDNYINSQTPYDRKLRVNKDEPVSIEEYFDFLKEQTIDWTDSEKNKIKEIVKNVKPLLEKYDLNLPATVLLVKTTGKEEGGAAYCRGNAIVFPQNILNQRAQSLETLFVHELFHIFTKNNLDARERLYDIINFKKCEKVELPQTLLDIEVTNPDVPAQRYYIELKNGEKTINVIPMITVPNFYFGRSRPFFSFLRLEFIEIENINGQYKYKRSASGEPVVYNQNQLADLLNKVGNNTSYLIHPEEILADNFSLMVLEKQNVNSQWVIDKMKPLLENKNKNVVGTN